MDHEQDNRRRFLGDGTRLVGGAAEINPEGNLRKSPRLAAKIPQQASPH